MTERCNTLFTWQRMRKRFWRCYPVLKQLRLHLDESALVSQVMRQQAQGYFLAYLESERRNPLRRRLPILRKFILWQVDVRRRSCHQLGEPVQGYGQLLFDWLVAEARKNGCSQLTLAFWRATVRAHRFYLRKGMDIVSHHFAMRLS